jgi:hypothetical protein
MKADEVINYSMRSFTNKLNVNVNAVILDNSNPKSKTIMCVNMYEYIVTDKFKDIKHSFSLGKLRVSEFVAYMKIKYNNAFTNSNHLIDNLTILDDDFNEHIFKANEYIEY